MNERNSKHQLNNPPAYAEFPEDNNRRPTRKKKAEKPHESYDHKAERVFGNVLGGAVLSALVVGGGFVANHHLGHDDKAPAIKKVVVDDVKKGETATSLTKGLCPEA